MSSAHSASGLHVPRVYTLRPLDEKITVGPRGGFREGQLRIHVGSENADPAVVLTYVQGQQGRALRLLSEGGDQDYKGGERRNEVFSIPRHVLPPSLGISYNLYAATWVHVERHFMGKDADPSIIVVADFPGEPKEEPHLPEAAPVGWAFSQLKGQRQLLEASRSG